MSIKSKLRFKSLKLETDQPQAWDGVRDTTKAGNALMFRTKLNRCNYETVANCQAYITYTWCELHLYAW